MGLGLDKCCCFIPLRLGTCLIAIYFFAVYLFYSTTGFIGVNAAVFYSGQSAKAWYYINQLFTVFICVGGLVGIFGSCFSSRRFAQAFSIITWVGCVMSIVVYIITLVLVIVYHGSIVDSCRAIGFVGIKNIHRDITPVHLNNQQYYTPVKYPGIYTENAGSESDCRSVLKSFVILYGLVTLFLQFIQIYFAYVVSAYAKRLKNGARHHRLHAQQIKDFEEARYHMSTVY
ncbi:hypothetical protein BDB01DRAFT_799514 [Pilobolus umbonatus]|nr:hypothetical protein BDB01DRAFT_799514 [Pilobolus umbonatus]